MAEDGEGGNMANPEGFNPNPDQNPNQAGQPGNAGENQQNQGGEPQYLPENALPEVIDMGESEGALGSLEPNLREQQADYYATQIGTIPKPDYVGFRTADEFASLFYQKKRNTIPMRERVFRFRQQYEGMFDPQKAHSLELLDSDIQPKTPDQRKTEIDTLKEFQLTVARAMAKGARLEPVTKVITVQVPKRNRQSLTETMPQQVRVISGFTLKDSSGGVVVIDGRRVQFEMEANRDLNRSGVLNKVTTAKLGGQEDPLAEEKLIILQYLQLQEEQESWVDEHLQDVAEAAESDEDLNLRLNAIRNSADSFLGPAIRDRYSSMLTIVHAKLAFRKSGMEAIAGQGDELMKYMPHLMRLPGVAELMAEMDRREAFIRIRKDGNGEYQRLTPAERDRQWAQMRAAEAQVNPDDPTGEGGLNLTAARDARNNPEMYNKIRKSLVRSVQPGYAEWQRDKLDKLQAELDDPEKTRTLDQKIAKQRQILLLERQSEVSELSLEAAEWMYRIAGRPAFWGDDTVPGQIRQYELAGFGEWVAKKQKAWTDPYLAAFGTVSQQDIIENCLPGEARGPDFHPLWYDYFANYAIFYPGQQGKPALVDAYAKSHNNSIKGMRRVDHEVEERVDHIWQRYKHFLDERNIPGLVNPGLLSELSHEDQKALDEWNSAKIMELDPEYMRAIADNDFVWLDWADYVGDDYKKATDLKGKMIDFLNGPTSKGIGEMKSTFWGRSWKGRYFTKRAMETMIEFRTRYNRRNDMGNNWSSELVEDTLVDNRKVGAINKYDEEELAAEYIGKTFNINLPGRKTPIQLKWDDMPEPLAEVLVKTKKFVPKIIVWIWKTLFSGVKDFNKKANPTSGHH